MRTYNNELTVRRNETFTIDKIVENKDGSPYIISKRLVNPYFLITIVSSTYDQKDRYTCNMWLPVALPRFDGTTPVNIADFTDISGKQLYKTFEDLSGLPSGYLNGVNITFEKDDALFYQETSDGKRIYKYYDDGWKDYECRIVCKFLQSITKDWIERSYVYSIELVDGTKSENPNKPLKNFSEVIPILTPTKLSVLSNLKGGM